MSPRVSLALIQDAVARLQRLAPFLSPIERIKLDSLKKNVAPIWAHEAAKNDALTLQASELDIGEIRYRSEIDIQRMDALKRRTSLLLERSRDALVSSRALLGRIETR